MKLEIYITDKTDSTDREHEVGTNLADMSDLADYMADMSDLADYVSLEKLTNRG